MTTHTQPITDNKSNLRDFKRSKKPTFSKLAVIIGIEDYKNNVPALDTPINDAVALAAVLKEQGYTIANPTQNASTETPIYKDLTGKEIIQLLDVDLKKMVTPKTRLVFYFAGHGTRIKTDDNKGAAGYLLPADAEHDNVSSFIPMDIVRNALDVLPCHHKLVILDCCHAGVFRWTGKRKKTRSWANNQKTYREQYESYLKHPVYQVITSAGQQEKALDEVEIDEEELPTYSQREQIDGHSPFALALIQALDESVDKPELESARKDGVILASELTVFLKNSVKQIAKSQQNHNQTPQIFPLTEQDGGEFLFESKSFQIGNLDSWGKKNIYKGLAPFEEADSPFFFGREEEIAKLTALVESKRNTENKTGQFFIVTGPAKSGKSSLIQAGLIPALKQSSQRLNATHQLEILQPIEAPSEPKSAISLALSTYKATLANKADSNKDKRGILLIVDNIEQFAGSIQPDEMVDFLRQTQKDWDDKLHILITTGQPSLKAQLPTEEGANTHQFNVEQINKRDVIENMITGPAARMMLEFKPASLIDSIIDSFTKPLSLPLFSHLMHQTYEAYSQEKKKNVGKNSDEALTESHLEHINAALRQNLESVYGKLDNDHRLSMKRILLRLISPTQSECILREAVSASEFDYSDPQENKRVRHVLSRLKETGILIGDKVLNLAHHQIVESWDEFKLWQAEAKDSIYIHQALSEAVKDWANEEGIKQNLWNRNIYLDSVKEWPHYQLNKKESEFVKVSVAKQKREQKIIWASIAAVIVALMGLSFWAFTQRNLALEQEAIAIVARENALAQEAIAIDERENALAQEAIAIVARENALTQEAIAIDERENALAQETIAIVEKEKAQVQALLSLANSQFSAARTPTTATYERALLMMVQSADLIDQSKIEISPDFLDEQVRLLMDDLPVTIQFEGWTFNDFLYAAAFSPDQQTVVTGANNGTLIIWDVNATGYTDQPIAVVPAHQPDNWIFDVVFSPDGSILATTSQDGTLSFWHSETYLPIKQVTVHADLYHYVLDLAFSPNGQILASASTDGQIRLWDTTDGSLAGQINAHDNRVTGIAFSPTDNLLVSSSWDGFLRFWNPGNGELIDEINVFEGNEHTVNHVSFSPDGRKLATGSTDGRVQLWDVSSRNPIMQILSDHKGAVNKVSFSPDGSQLASASDDRQIKLWDLTSQDDILDPISIIGHEAPVTSIEFSKDGNSLASASSYRTVRLWDLTKNDRSGKNTVLTGHEEWVYSSAFSPDAKNLVSGSLSGDVMLWSLTDSDPAEAPILLQGHSDTVLSVAFSSDNRTFAAGSMSGEIIVWDTEHIRKDKNYQGYLLPWSHSYWIYGIAFAPDGKRLVSGSIDGTVGYWDISAAQNDPAYRPIILEGHTNGIAAIAYSPDGTKVASGDFSGEIIIWDMPVGNRPEIIVWDTPVGNRPEILLRFGDRNSAVRGVAFSPDGKSLAAGSQDKLVRIWDLDQAEDQNYEPMVLKGHQRFVTSVAYAPDGNTIATSSDDSSIRLWHLDQDDPESSHTALTGHNGWVFSVKYSPDGQNLASTSTDGTIMIWSSIDQLLELACLQTSRNFTWEEWQEYLPGRQYQKTCEYLPVHRSLCQQPVEIWPQGDNSRSKVCQS